MSHLRNTKSLLFSSLKDNLMLLLLTYCQLDFIKIHYFVICKKNYIYFFNVFHLTVQSLSVMTKQSFCIYMCVFSVSSILYNLLTLYLPNSLNGITHLTFFALSIIIFRDIKMKT